MPEKCGEGPEVPATDTACHQKSGFDAEKARWQGEFGDADLFDHGSGFGDR